jgi:hypothetical protein
MTQKRKNRIIKEISQLSSVEESMIPVFTVNEVKTFIENNEDFIEEYETFEEQWNTVFNCLLGERFFNTHNIDISEMVE